MKIRNATKTIYMIGFGFLAIPFYAVGALAAIVLAYLAFSSVAGIFWTAYNAHLAITLAAGLVVAIVALAIDYVLRLPRSVEIKTHGLWGTVAWSAILALFFGGMAASHAKRTGLTETMSSGFILAASGFFVLFFLWPVVKNFYQVWRASLTLRSTSSPDRFRLDRGGAVQSRDRALPAPRR